MMMMMMIRRVSEWMCVYTIITMWNQQVSGALSGYYELWRHNWQYDVTEQQQQQCVVLCWWLISRCHRSAPAPWQQTTQHAAHSATLLPLMGTEWLMHWPTLNTRLILSLGLSLCLSVSLCVCLCGDIDLCRSLTHDDFTNRTRTSQSVSQSVSHLHT